MARRDRSEQVRELASVLFRLMREHETATHKRLKVSPSLSRILGHAPEWRALRLRGEPKDDEARLAKEPSFFAIADAAKELNVPICALVPTLEHQPLTPAQQRLLTLAARWTLANFAPRHEERSIHTSDFDDFEAYVTFQKLEYDSAAGVVGVDDQLTPELIDVLDSIPAIRSERMQVTTVRGNSMADRLRGGDRILVDTYLRQPRNGEMIVVDRGHLGRTIGYWRRDGKRSFLDKENETPIDLGAPDDFSILGTVVAIVWAPIARRAR
jgi:phage repressor protein C with HTH and peptisase S24 domain